MNQVTQSSDNNIIRSMVRGVYALQLLRVQTGNRITVNFKSKLGQTQDGMSESELEAVQKTILETLRLSYDRITDGIVEEGVVGKFPSMKKFEGDEVISTYAELVLIEQYMDLLRNENNQFKLLNKILKDIPIYDTFLKDIKGIGPAMAGIIISEIDITRSKYASSLWKYAGLDVISIGRYTDAAGKEHTVHPREIDAHFERYGDQVQMLAENKYPVIMDTQGRSRKDVSLVNREYTNKDGQQAERKSITYNPFLKTKLIGVLGSSFLRGVVTYVDGNKLGAARRLKMAKDLGYKPSAKGEEDDGGVDLFLRSKGHTVVREASPYAQAYYDYRNRLDNDTRHDSKSDGHKHAMAVRYMVKRFLADLYQAWRPLEGLVAYDDYATAKLGLTHGIDQKAA